MEGVSSLTALCEAARAQGADTLALTDTNGLYGAIRFLEIAKETGLRPILGAELKIEPHYTRYLHPARPRARQDELVSPVAQARTSVAAKSGYLLPSIATGHMSDVGIDTPLSHRAVLLVKNPDGYSNLCRLLSARHCDDAFDFISAVARYREGLIILSDDQDALMAWKKESPEDLYVELTPGAMMHQALAFSWRAGLPP